MTAVTSTTQTLPIALPAFSDNYLWVLKRQQQALVVDPGDANVVQDFLSQQQLSLHTILLTHHHSDHIGGVYALRQRWPQVTIYGPQDPRMPAAIQTVSDGQRLALTDLDLTFDVIAVPGHTLTHIAYYGLITQPATNTTEVTEVPLLFCGDTLFSAGCGRLFEGSAAQMQHSLDRLATLPDATLVYPAHEYTQSNCRFALAVEPDNAQLQAYHEQVVSRRQQHLPTVPTRLGAERTYNPFLRTREPSVIRAAQQQVPGCGSDAAAVFAVIRHWKDTF